MARRVFFSFHYQLDSWRVQKIMNMGALERQPLLNSQDWEDVARGGDAAIKRWIDGQMKDKTCNIVLIGSQTAGRPWVEYEFRKAWDDGKGVLGIYIHRLTDSNNQIGRKGSNPVSRLSLKTTQGQIPLDQVISAYDPAGATSSDVYNTIAGNIEQWVEDAISQRKRW